MSLSRNIRSRLGQLRFLKEVQKHTYKAEVIGFDTASSIGILYDATNERDYEAVKAYVKTVRGQYKKDILAMGFVDKKKLPPAQFAQYGLDFFTRSDLDFRLIPNNPIVKNFIEQKFDILINLNNGSCFPLRYIAALSKSRFRVGRYDSKSTSCYDMMLNLKGEPAIKEVIEETEHFLRKIKPELA
ncbi:MAG: hypothetical protein EYC69_07780 [Bacteroidetes bacterium]|nr:MAG: hypothetical protein EYC69_07780 [Bacteroidota bacterium]